MIMTDVVIDSRNLIIRNMILEDLDGFYNYRCNPEVTKYQGFDVMTLDECRDFIGDQKGKIFGKLGERIQYSIVLKHENTIIGDCAIKLDQYDSRIAEVGMTISHLYQRKGYAKEAMKAIMSFLFTEKNIHRIVEIVDIENKSAIGLLESIYFRKEGYFVENIFFKGAWGSEYQYAMLNSEREKL